MIASFSHDFIFLKTRKSGSTSLEIVLSSWCVGHDICTPFNTQDEKLRRAHGGVPRNFRGPAGGFRFYNHMPASEVGAKLPQLWNRAFKFAVDRHPYEKVISGAWWNVGIRGGDPDTELNGEIEQIILDRSYLNHPIYLIDGRLAVDELWRYEDAWERLAGLAHRLGVIWRGDKPLAKAGYRKDRRDAMNLLSESQCEQIYRDARIEFELLGYQP